VDSNQELAGLANAVAGPVLLCGDDGYAAECAVHNLHHPQEPAVAVGATSASDVQAAIHFARRNGMPVAVRSSGHQMVQPGSGAVLITTNRMDDITIDSTTRTARVGAGARWQPVIDVAAEPDLAPLSGSAPAVGVVGYTLGGGLSPLLGRRLGYAADHVVAIEIVTADGELRRVTAQSETDLFWALRGGKGNFGVVTALEFTLFPVTRYYGGGLYFSGHHLADVLHAWHGWVTEVPEEMTSSVAIQRLPADPALPEPLRGSFVVNVRIGFLGPAGEAEQLIAPLRAIGPTVLDTIAETPYAAMASLHADPVAPMPYYDRTTSLRELTPATVDTLVDLLGASSGCRLASVEIRALGGGFDRPPAAPDAIATRGVPYVVFGFGVGDIEQADLLRGQLAALVDGLAPWAAERLVINFLSPDEGTSPAQMRSIYGEEIYERLTTVKAAYDPTNMFRLNHNVAPTP
jgi:FAD/FMN-containing dehydrogenase